MGLFDRLADAAADVIVLPVTVPIRVIEKLQDAADAVLGDE